MGRALMPQPQDLFGVATSDEPDYPSAARRVEVEADITVSWRRDALGRPVEPRVGRRTIKMPPDAKTLQTAWLEHFDALALAKARAMKPRPPAADADPAALHHAEFRFHLAP
jgi:hypothetical protein